MYIGSFWNSFQVGTLWHKAIYLMPKKWTPQFSWPGHIGLPGDFCQHTSGGRAAAAAAAAAHAAAASKSGLHHLQQVGACNCVTVRRGCCGNLCIFQALFLSVATALVSEVAIMVMWYMLCSTYEWNLECWCSVPNSKKLFTNYT